LYRTAPGHHQATAAEQLGGVYRPGGDGDQCGALYQPRKLIADFYRHRERRSDQLYHHQQQQQRSQQHHHETGGGTTELGGDEGHQLTAGDAGRLVKSASVYDGSPPAAEATNYFNGRRQTWPLGGTSAPLPVAVRRRAQHDQSYVEYADDEEDVDKVDRIVDRDRSAILQQSAAAAAAAAAASPISRLIQRYDQLTSSAAGDAFPVPATHTPPGGVRADWGFPALSWQPAITSAGGVDCNSSLTENSSSAISDLAGEAIKTYSCHICSYIGQ